MTATLVLGGWSQAALWVVRGAVIAFVGSVCGAFYPAWMAARKDVIDALAYE